MSETRKQQAEAGWKVVGSLGKYIGKVEHVREDHLIVAQGRFFSHTLYIPVSHVAESADGVVKLTLPATDADSQGWRFPPNAGFAHGEADFWDSPVAAATQASGTPGGFGKAMGAPHGEFTDNRVDSEEMQDLSTEDTDGDGTPQADQQR